LEGEEGESISSPSYGDRLDYNLPQNQINFLKKIRETTQNPVIAVVTGGSPMNLVEVHELADAVLLIWYPGEEGGNAVADVVFGKTSPSGRLPLTFPKSLDQLPPYESYAMKGRTYRYMQQEPMYPFGYGLSYTKFVYDAIKTPSTTVSLKNKASIAVETKVTNTGTVESEEVVQMYLTDMESSVSAPLFSLKGMKRVKLKPGESTTVKFTVTPEMMLLVNDKGESVLEPGKFKISIGGALPSARSEALGAAKPAELIFTLK
jgi:beta-glucosidase